MLQIPNDIENLEKQKFDLEGKSYTFYTPDYDTDISPENIEFLKDQSEDILSLFLSYIDSNRGYVFDLLSSEDQETVTPYRNISKDQINLEYKYCHWVSIFIDSMPTPDGDTHLEIVLYFWKSSDFGSEIYKELIWSNHNFVV
mgnify:CR=1 FL=1